MPWPPYRVGRQAVPAAVRELLVGVAEAGRRDHLAVLVARAGHIARVVQGRQHVAGELAGRVQHRGDRLGVGGREGAGEPAEVRGFRQSELQVPHRGFVGHERPSSSSRAF